MTDINIDGIVPWLSNWFQDKLVSGTNIKTVNNQSLLGSGNINIGGGGGLSIDDVYPIGSIYMSTANVDPATLFGGTWERIQDKFLLAKGSTYSTLNGTGGSADAVNVAHSHTTGRDYILTTDGSGVSRVSTAGQTGTKVQNLLQSSDAIYRNTVDSAGSSGSGKNMPPYIVVNVWKRTG